MNFGNLDGKCGGKNCCEKKEADPLIMLYYLPTYCIIHLSNIFNVNFISMILNFKKSLRGILMTLKGDGPFEGNILALFDSKAAELNVKQLPNRSRNFHNTFYCLFKVCEGNIG